MARVTSWLGGLLVALGASAAAADCGLPPASDAALLASPDAAAAVERARAELPNAEGRLWRVGTEPPSWLVGTFHLKAGGVERPGPVVEAIVDAADTLFVEVDAAAMEAAIAAWASDPSKLFRDDGTRLSAEMTAEEEARAEAVFADYGIPFAVADQMQPVLLFGLLSVPPCALAAADGDGLDAVIEARARAAGVAIRPLETVEEQLAALDGPDMAPILRLLIAQAGELQDQWFVNLAFYRQGKIAALWVYGVDRFAAMVGEAEAGRIADVFWERLVASRNRRMVERMLPGLRDGGAVVAVGALHLPGEDGIVELLRAAGFEVTPVDEPALPDLTGEAGAQEADVVDTLAE